MSVVLTSQALALFAATLPQQFEFDSGRFAPASRPDRPYRIPPSDKLRCSFPQMYEAFANVCQRWRCVDAPLNAALMHGALALRMLLFFAHSLGRAVTVADVGSEHQTPAARRYNWALVDLVSRELFQLCVAPREKSLVVAGDRDALTRYYDAVAAAMIHATSLPQTLRTDTDWSRHILAPLERTVVEMARTLVVAQGGIVALQSLAASVADQHVRLDALNSAEQHARTTVDSYWLFGLSIILRQAFVHQALEIESRHRISCLERNDLQRLRNQHATLLVVSQHLADRRREIDFFSEYVHRRRSMTELYALAYGRSLFQLVGTLGHEEASRSALSSRQEAFWQDVLKRIFCVFETVASLDAVRLAEAARREILQGYFSSQLRSSLSAGGIMRKTRSQTAPVALTPRSSVVVMEASSRPSTTGSVDDAPVRQLLMIPARTPSVLAHLSVHQPCEVTTSPLPAACLTPPNSESTWTRPGSTASLIPPCAIVSRPEISASIRMIQASLQQIRSSVAVCERWWRRHGPTVRFVVQRLNFLRHTLPRMLTASWRQRTRALNHPCMFNRALGRLVHHGNWEDMSYGMAVAAAWVKLSPCATCWSFTRYFCDLLVVSPDRAKDTNTLARLARLSHCMCCLCHRALCVCCGYDDGTMERVYLLAALGITCQVADCFPKFRLPQRWTNELGVLLVQACLRYRRSRVLTSSREKRRSLRLLDRRALAALASVEMVQRRWRLLARLRRLAPQRTTQCGCEIVMEALVQRLSASLPWRMSPMELQRRRPHNYVGIASKRLLRYEACVVYHDFNASATCDELAVVRPLPCQEAARQYYETVQKWQVRSRSAAFVADRLRFLVHRRRRPARSSPCCGRRGVVDFMALSTAKHPSPHTFLVERHAACMNWGCAACYAFYQSIIVRNRDRCRYAAYVRYRSAFLRHVRLTLRTQPGYLLGAPVAYEARSDLVNVGMCYRCSLGRACLLVRMATRPSDDESQYVTIVRCFFCQRCCVVARCLLQPYFLRRRAFRFVQQRCRWLRRWRTRRSQVLSTASVKGECPRCRFIIQWLRDWKRAALLDPGNTKSMDRTYRRCSAMCPAAHNTCKLVLEQIATQRVPLPPALSRHCQGPGHLQLLHSCNVVQASLRWRLSLIELAARAQSPRRSRQLPRVSATSEKNPQPRLKQTPLSGASPVLVPRPTPSPCASAVRCDGCGFEQSAPTTAFDGSRPWCMNCGQFL